MDHLKRVMSLRFYKEWVWDPSTKHLNILLITTNMNQIWGYSFNEEENNHPKMRTRMGYNSVPLFLR